MHEPSPFLVGRSSSLAIQGLLAGSEVRLELLEVNILRGLREPTELRETRDLHHLLTSLIGVAD